jgi:cytosine/adenosine deaminase-related metal-dependent hydrolase
VPDYLCETAGESYEQTRALIRRWHQRGRLGYARPGLLVALSGSFAQIVGHMAIHHHFPGDQAHIEDMRLIAGKVMMDRHVPDYLCETAGESYEQTRALISLPR